MAAENDKRTLSRALADGYQLATVHAHVFSLTIMFQTTQYWCKKTNAAAMLVDETFLGKWNSVFMPFITWLKSIYGMVRLLLLSSIISAPVFVDATTPAADSTTKKFNKRRAAWKEINNSNQIGNNENWSNSWSDPTQNSTKTELYSVTEKEMSVVRK